MMYKQILVPDKKNHSIEIPEQFFDKKVEIIVVELDSAMNEIHPTPPAGKEVSVNELLEHFGAAPDFPTVDEIRAKGWPSNW